MADRPDPTTHAGPAPRWGLGDAVVAVLAALLLSGLLAAAILTQGEDPTLAQQFVLNIPLWLAFGLVPIWATRTKGAGPVADLGLRIVPIDLPIGLIVGAALQLAVIPALYWLAGDLLPSDEVEEPARELVESASGIGGWALLVLMTVVLAPLVEEIFYRGLVQASLARHMAPVLAAVVTAGVFAGMHFQALQLPGLFVFGLAAGLLVARTGRLGPAITTHVVFNACALWQVA